MLPYRDLIEPNFAIRLVMYGGWALVALGLLKIVIWTIGELAPGCYQHIKSEGVRKFLTGKGNRLLFGLGGFITALLGGVFIGLAFLMRFLFALSTGSRI